MVLHIPSNHKSFVIHITISVKHPMVLALRVYDPYHPHTYFFSRKAGFTKDRMQRTLTITMPLSSKEVMLEVYDKNHSGKDRFILRDFNIELLDTPKVWAKPEQHRFMEFAMDFAKKAGYTKTGFFESPDSEYLFQYLPTITDAMGNELITPARTHRRMPRVQISKKLFNGYTVPIRVAILAHEGCHWFLNTRSQKVADLCGMKLYLDYGFPKIEAVYSVTKVFGGYPELVGERHIQRTKDVIDFITNYKPVS